MSARLSIKVIIGLVVIELVGIAGCAGRKPSAASPDALSHYRNGWLKHFGKPTEKPDWEKKAAVKAAAEFQKAIQIEPENVIFRQSLAFAFEKLGKTGEAEEQYKEAINLKPEDSFLHYALARLYAKEKSAQGKAISELTIAIQQNPDEALFHYHLAHLLYTKAGRYNSDGEYLVTDGKVAQEAFAEVRTANEKAHFTEYLAPYPKEFSSKMDYIQVISLWAGENLPQLSMMRALARENIAMGKLYEKQGNVEKGLEVYQASFIMGRRFAEQKQLSMIKMFVGVAIDQMALGAMEELYSAQGMQEGIQWTQSAEEKLKEIQESSKEKAADMSKHASPYWTRKEKELMKEGKDFFFFEAPFVREMLKIWPKR